MILRKKGIIPKEKQKKLLNLKRNLQIVMKMKKVMRMRMKKTVSQVRK